EGDPWMSIKNSSAQNTYYFYKNGKFDTVSFPTARNSETVVMPIGNTLIFERSFTLHSMPLSIRKGPLNSTILQLPTEHINDCIYIKDSAILCIYDNKILAFKNNSIIDSASFPAPLQGLYKDNGNNLWILSKNGAYVFNGSTLSDSPEYYFETKNITGMLQDAEGNYWFTTLDQGVFMATSLQFKNNTVINEKITDLAVCNNKLYGTTFSRKIFTVTGGATRYQSATTRKNIKRYNEACIILGNQYIINPDGSIIESMAVTMQKCYTWYNNNIFTGFTKGFQFVDANGKRFFSRDKNFKLRVISCCNNGKDMVWIGTLFGLYSFSPVNYEIKKIELLKQRTNVLAYDNSTKTLIAGTAGEGLYFIRGSSKKVITEADGLAANYINTLLLQNDTLWVGTNKGLSRVILSPDGTPGHIESYSREDGLASNEINVFALHNNLIWIGTNKGLTYVNPAALTPGKPVKIPVYLTNVVINDSLYKWDKKDLFLKHDQKNLTINYSNVVFGKPSATAYYYKLDGLHTTWVKTSEKNVKFMNLPPGSYTFHVASAGPNNTVDLDHTASVKIFIARHFTQTWWFITICVVTGLLLIIYSLYLYIRNHKKKLAVQRNIILSEQKALRAQMNPHFIFNALNSVQYYITENDKRSAGIFLAKFSGLIRSVLENSNQSTVSLEEELDTVKKYLELEQIRFGNRFHYQINIDDTLSLSDIKIPAMLIQPFLENAIWHGLMPKKEQGNLYFSVRHEGNEVICIIEDDGIGREQAALIKRNKPGHTSSAIKNIEERLNFIKLLLRINIKLAIEDLFDSNNKSAGTRVYLKIQMQK
ncbi:MAG TPA: histidine kinase, partial [Bacteroidia bacterium]|nr:histidine kinase [Bacteroidia bacterium]